MRFSGIHYQSLSKTVQYSAATEPVPETATRLYCTYIAQERYTYLARHKPWAYIIGVVLPFLLMSAARVYTAPFYTTLASGTLATIDWRTYKGHFCTIPIKLVGYISLWLSHLGAIHAAITTALIVPHAQANASLLELLHQSCSLMGDFKCASSLPLARKRSRKRLADSDMYVVRKKQDAQSQKDEIGAVLEEIMFEQFFSTVWPAMHTSANYYPMLYYRDRL